MDKPQLSTPQPTEFKETIYISSSIVLKDNKTICNNEDDDHNKKSEGLPAHLVCKVSWYIPVQFPTCAALSTRSLMEGCAWSS